MTERPTELTEKTRQADGCRGEALPSSPTKSSHILLFYFFSLAPQLPLFHPGGATPPSPAPAAEPLPGEEPSQRTGSTSPRWTRARLRGSAGAIAPLPAVRPGPRAHTGRAERLRRRAAGEASLPHPPPWAAGRAPCRLGADSSRAPPPAALPPLPSRCSRPAEDGGRRPGRTAPRRS